MRSSRPFLQKHWHIQENKKYYQYHRVISISPHSADPKYSLVIPAYNEANRISRLLSELDDEAFEYIFVCDGTDNTPEIITSYFQDKSYQIQCLTFPERKGKGGGIFAGFQATRGSLIGFMDADLSASFETIKSLFERLETEMKRDPSTGAVIGSRYAKDAQICKPQPLSRRFLSRCFNIATKLLFHLSYYDTQCGAKVCTKEAFTSISRKVRSTGFEFDVEFIWRLEQAGYRVDEVAIVWADAEDSRVSFSTPLQMFWGLIKLRCSIFFE
ncbi:MAG: glycosyltransferase [Methanomicrobiales archaeon]|jgi:glycosyltransferase involved in cell wall biosynthesis|nr:glycosyltransferase [Methanomicrobiales archaeon]